MNPDLVMRCFGAGCERRRDCARYAAYLLDTVGDPLAGFNVCEHTHSDRFIPLSQSPVHVIHPVYGTHGALPHTPTASAKCGGSPTPRGSQI